MKNVERAIVMLNEAMYEVFKKWPKPEDLKAYAWGWRKYYGEIEGGIVGNNHGTTFYYVEEVVNILKANELTFYLTMTENADGEPTPGIAFF